MRRGHTVRISAAAALLALLAGCGQKGPLYLPEKKPAAVTAPATAPPPASQPQPPPQPQSPQPQKSDSDKDSDATPPPQ